MKEKYKFAFFFIAIVLSIFSGKVFADSSGFIFQNFESASPLNGQKKWGCTYANRTTEQAHTGSYSFKVQGVDDWMNYYIYNMAGGPETITDFLTGAERITFWVYAAGDPKNKTLEMKFWDNNTYSENAEPDGYQVENMVKVVPGEWVQMTVLFSEFPDNFDLSNVTNIGVMHQEGGTYYVDDFEVIHGDRVAQSFEIQKRGYDPADPDDVADYAGWGWDDTDVSLVTDAGGEAPIEGDYCLKVVIDRPEGIHIGGVGLRSEVRSYDESNQYLTYNLQDLNPSQNDHFSFWVKAYPDDEILYTLCGDQYDHNLGLEIFDKETHWQFEGGVLKKFEYISDDPGTPENEEVNNGKVVWWTDKKMKYGEWTKFVIPFETFRQIDKTALATEGSEADNPVDFTKVDKIQISFFWDGIYYIDEVKTSSSVPKWDLGALRDGVLAWEVEGPLDQYRVQKNDGSGWVDATVTEDLSIPLQWMSETRLRVRSEETGSELDVPFISAWSEEFLYKPIPVLINKKRLDRDDILEWFALPGADTYRVEMATSVTGPWVFKDTLSADQSSGAKDSGANQGKTYFQTSIDGDGDNVFYRVRGEKGSDVSLWSPVHGHNLAEINSPVLATSGQILRNGKGQGDIVKLNGVNLGSMFMTEGYMDYFGYRDECETYGSEWWSEYEVREFLKSRGFSNSQIKELYDAFEKTIITEHDFNLMMDLGISYVRVPLYYIRHNEIIDSMEPGVPPQWADDTFDFDRLDWVVDQCANRGIYVCLDLHGAPGHQSARHHSGRKNYDQLFDKPNAVHSAAYKALTIDLWERIADRYKDNTYVDHEYLMGYELLNEPWQPEVQRSEEEYPDHPVPYEPFSGCGSEEELWDLYDDLYAAIRAKDPNKIIIMKGIWAIEDNGEWDIAKEDWETLPDPLSTLKVADRNGRAWSKENEWHNVMYSFNFYFWDKLETFPDRQAYIDAHKDFIDGKIAQADDFQTRYDIPETMGEFNCFDVEPGIWDYYISKFNENQWSWNVWSWKVNFRNSAWGLLNGIGNPDEDFRNELPKIKQTIGPNEETGEDVVFFEPDDYATLLEKVCTVYDSLIQFDLESQAKIMVDSIGIFADNLVYIWLGNDSSNWNDAGNWSSCILPGFAHNVNIRSIRTCEIVWPEITGTASCNDLTIECGAYLTVSDGAILNTKGMLSTRGSVTLNGTIVLD